MGAPDIGGALAAARDEIEEELARALREEPGIPRRLRRAMRHSLLGGGKRLRPILFLWTRDALVRPGRRAPLPRRRVLQAAAALEMLHTYSLIHDDLPAMDDDDLRRGRPSCHVAFDEATAILAGDGLQALAFAVLGRAGGAAAGDLVATVADAVGPAGMVGGQQRDLDAEGREVSPNEIRRIHRAKTARLLSGAMEAGAILAGAGPKRRASLREAGMQLGLAFQEADDVLDVTSDAQTLGKTVGKDADAGKATWVARSGLASARRRVRRLGLSGERLLAEAIPAGENRTRLMELARLMWERDR